jgi:hypothetical protein
VTHIRDLVAEAVRTAELQHLGVDAAFDQSFDRVGVRYALQNEMIALLAPTQREIVKR